MSPKPYTFVSESKSKHDPYRNWAYDKGDTEKNLKKLRTEDSISGVDINEQSEYEAPDEHGTRIL